MEVLVLPHQKRTGTSGFWWRSRSFIWNAFYFKLSIILFLRCLSERCYAFKWVHYSCRSVFWRLVRCFSGTDVVSSRVDVCQCMCWHLYGQTPGSYCVFFSCVSPLACSNVKKSFLMSRVFCWYNEDYNVKQTLSTLCVCARLLLSCILMWLCSLLL